jgi:hypothetical protein
MDMWTMPLNGMAGSGSEQGGAVLSHRTWDANFQSVQQRHRATTPNERHTGKRFETIPSRVLAIFCHVQYFDLLKV